MAVARYSYINAKIRARKAELLTEEQWDALLGARDMQAALRILDGTGYSDLVRELEANITADQLERILQEDFNNVLQEILIDAPEAAQKILIWVQRKYQKETIKGLIRLKAAGANREMAEQLLIPIEPFTSETLLTLYDAGDMSLLAQNLPIHFFKKLLEDALPAYEETEDLMGLEQVIDAAVFENLYKQTHTLSGKDFDHTEKLVGLEVDLINVLIGLRSHLLGLNKDQTKAMLLARNERKSYDLAYSAIDARTFEEAVELFTTGRFTRLMQRAMEAYEQYQTLQVFEHAFHQAIFQASRETMLGDPFNFGVVLGYLNLKWYETMNLKALIHGKAENLDPNIIRRTLIL
jgi:V/A-type H+-transporting ATPase subunit C